MKRWQIIIGIISIFFGLIALFETVFQIDLGRFIGPLILIGIGLLLVLRPQMAGPDVDVEMTLLGDTRKTGYWDVKNQEIWSFVGTTRLDFTNATLDEEEKIIKVIGFVKDLKIVVPDDVGVRFESTAFVSEIKALEGRQERFFGAMQYQTPNYEVVNKRVSIHAIAFVSEITIKPSLL